MFSWLPSPDWKRAEQKINEVFETVKKKNEDYGSSIAFTGKAGLGARLVDKAYRFLNLSLKNSKNFESEEDSIRDLIGYCILYYAYKIDEEGKVDE